MADPLVFTLPGKPVAWSRPRFNRATGNVFNSSPLRSFEALVKYTAGQEMKGRAPFAGPVELTIRVQVAPARSWSKVWQAAALTGALRPTSKPDASNVAKSIEDAMNSIVYNDDSQVVRLLVEKRYGAEDLTVVDVRAAA